MKAIIAVPDVSCPALDAEFLGRNSEHLGLCKLLGGDNRDVVRDGLRLGYERLRHLGQHTTAASCAVARALHHGWRRHGVHFT